jgi:hypothetical protein
VDRFGLPKNKRTIFKELPLIKLVMLIFAMTAVAGGFRRSWRLGQMPVPSPGSGTSQQSRRFPGPASAFDHFVDPAQAQ